jgi:hypothetical protein
LINSKVSPFIAKLSQLQLQVSSLHLLNCLGQSTNGVQVGILAQSLFSEEREMSSCGGMSNVRIVMHVYRGIPQCDIRNPPIEDSKIKSVCSQLSICSLVNVETMIGTSRTLGLHHGPARIILKQGKYLNGFLQMLRAPLKSLGQEPAGLFSPQLTINHDCIGARISYNSRSRILKDYSSLPKSLPVTQ